MTLSTPRPIDEYTDVDRRRFEEDIRPRGQPAVLRDLAGDWPAVLAARRSDEDLVAYLRRFRTAHPVPVIVGDPAIGGRFFYDETMTALNFGAGTSRLDPFFDRLLRDRTNERPFAIAVQSTPIPEALPGFDSENDSGLLDPTIVPRMWMGNAGRVAAHYDLKENIGCVVAGRRRFTLFPPDQIANLYVGPLEITPAGTPISLVDLQAPDLTQHPRFVDALAVAQTAELAPGDAIYIPYHWWHAVDSVATFNLFVNYWWNSAPAGSGNPYDALMFALYAIRALPDEQRAVWRTVFDHYVFEANGDPAAHIVPAARGALGARTPEQAMRMRETLRRLAKSL